MAVSDLFDLTEFTFIDPDAVHLVKRPANGVDSPLLAKAAESIDEAVEELTKQFNDGFCGDKSCTVCEGRFSALYKADPSFMEKAEMKAKERHALSGSDFAFPKERKEPLNDASHVRNAMSRFSQVEGVSAEERKAAARTILRRAKELGIDVSDDSDVARAAKAADTSESLSQTREVDGGPEGESSDPDNEDRGDARSVSFPHGAASDGAGDTAPDKAVPESEAESQTHDDVEGNAAKAEVDGTGDTAPDKGLHQDEAESQTRRDSAETPPTGGTPEEAEAEDASKDAPGSPSWEHKDVALGEKAESLVNELREVVTTFTEREKAEGGVTAKQRRVLSRVNQLLENPALLKEVAETMSAVDVLKTLGEQDSDSARTEDEAKKASEKAFEKAVRKEAKKLAKRMTAEQDDVAKDSEESKATEDIASMSKKDLREQLEELTKRVEGIASQDGKRPFVNELGVTSILRGENAPSVFKALDDRVASAEEALTKATSEIERSRAETELQTARQQRLMAKAVARENARERGQMPPSPRGPNSTELFTSGLSTLPEDSGLQYVGRS